MSEGIVVVVEQPKNNETVVTIPKKKAKVPNADTLWYLHKQKLELILQESIYLVVILTVLFMTIYFKQYLYLIGLVIAAVSGIIRVTVDTILYIRLKRKYGLLGQ